MLKSVTRSSILLLFFALPATATIIYRAPSCGERFFGSDLPHLINDNVLFSATMHSTLESLRLTPARLRDALRTSECEAWLISSSGRDPRYVVFIPPMGHRARPLRVEFFWNQSKETIFVITILKHKSDRDDALISEIQANGTRR